MKTRSSRVASTASEPFYEVYAIKRSPKLETPAIFFSHKDAVPFMYSNRSRGATADIEFKTFKLLRDAAEYILKDHPTLRLSLQNYDDKKRKNRQGDDEDENDNVAPRSRKRQKSTTNDEAAAPASQRTTPIGTSTTNAANLLIGMSGATPTPPLRTSTANVAQPPPPADCTTVALQTALQTTNAIPMPPPPEGYYEVTTKVSGGRLGVKLTKGCKVVGTERPNIFVGDVVLRVNNTTVVGWTLRQFAQLMQDTAHLEERTLWIHRPMPKKAKGVDWKKRHIEEFDEKFQSLKKFKELYGDTDVPNRRAKYRVGDDKYIDQNAAWCIGLGQWVMTVRKQLKLYQIDPDASLLSKDQAWQLKHIDFCLEPKRGIGRAGHQLQPAWNEELYQELILFHEEHGHCEVPTHPLTPLRKWTDRIREAYKDLEEGIVATITDEEIAKLCTIGFDFSEKLRLTWEDSYERYLVFKATNPDKEPRPRSRLAAWVGRTRRLYTAFQAGQVKGPLTQERVDALNRAGFDWKLEAKKKVVLEVKTFDERLEELKEYKAKYGDCHVPQLYPGLGVWASKQRTQCRRWKDKKKYSAMTQERYDKLVEVGFSFERRKMGPRFHRGKSRFHKGVETGGVPHPLQNRQLELMAQERKKRLEATNKKPQSSADDDGGEDAVETDTGDPAEDFSLTMEEDEGSDGSESIDGHAFSS